MDKPLTGQPEPGWCPTIAGNIRGWKPMMRMSPDSPWIDAPTRSFPRHHCIGIPHPLKGGDVLSAIGLFGEAQAHALAWWCKAAADAEGKEIEVSAMEFEVVYEIKARSIAVPPKDPQ